MTNSEPYGFEEDVEKNEQGYYVWKLEKGCPACEKKCDDEGERLFALQCPVCEAPGCDECFPLGRGCPCPDCEDDFCDED